MSRAGVICEFNPFHYGHKFLIQNIKENFADETVCVMSGSFVQRGDIAITDKFTRAEAALTNGADAVIELPLPYSMSSARIFAENGVRIAHAANCDTLCFGAESDIDILFELADQLADDGVNARIRSYMNEGLYYPKALSLAVGEKYNGIINKPNNILALEYISACRKYGIRPAAIKRYGAGHDSPTIIGNIASASKIRELISSGEDWSKYSPMKIEAPCSISRLEPAILYRLKTITPEELKNTADVSEGLENRIAETAKNYNSVEEILAVIKTKRYTMSRLRRIILSAFLSVTDEMQNTPVPYLRILGIKLGKESLLKGVKLPLIVKTRTDYDKLDDSAKEIFNAEARATEAMNIAGDMRLNEFTNGVVKI